MNFRWTPRRDRELRNLREDLVDYAECARILGAGCTAEEAKARMKILKEQDRADDEIPREVGYAPQAPLHPVIGPDLASKEPPATEGVRPCTVAPRPVAPKPVAPRPAKIALPRFGEMEKRYDACTRALLEGQA